MKVKTTTGMIMESNNDLVIEQWKKHGYKEVSAAGRKPKEIPTEQEKE